MPAVGAFGACAVRLKYITQSGVFKIVNNQILNNGGYEYDWPTCKDINSQPMYADGVQECYGGENDLDNYKILGFNQTCTAITQQEVSGGTRFDILPFGTTNYCDCLPEEL